MAGSDDETSIQQQSAVIMIVEDDTDIRMMLNDLLSLHGYRTILMSGSEHAAEMVREARPDLIILDVWLEQPDSGWRLLDELHQDPRTHHIPVVVYSAHAYMLSTMATWLGEPHYAFVDKPFQAEDLLARIGAALGNAPPA
jgi:two-component system, NtrC family, nitrogen regulation response regulator NtrX